MRLRYGSGLVLMGMLWGCTMLPGAPPTAPAPASSPVFHAEASDTALLHTIQREQEPLLRTCTQDQSCDQVHFTQAMLALFQNGETAAASFQQALAAAPNGPFADSSARWIRFLAHRPAPSASTDEPQGALLGVMKGLVRTWLGQPRTARTTATGRTVEPAKSPDVAVPILQRQIRDREKRIAELTDQLSALKQIDLEAHRANKLSPPRTLSK
jgi:hypothetical protein